MSSTTRIVGFLVTLLLVFAGATLVGAKVDPSVDEPAESHEEDGMADEGHGASELPPGLTVAASGYRLVPERTEYRPDERAEFRFRIVDGEGTTVRDYEIEHEREMHLIVVRRDFTRFQHLHPRQLADGTWMVDADLGEGGVYRAFADFTTADASLTLATDLFVAGGFEPEMLPAPSTLASAGDGYEVELDAATPEGGTTAPVEFTVTRDGREVAAIEPYLGADGHLVALREHDQAYLHTHPEGEPGGPGQISFAVEYPTPGRYRLFLQFKHRGEVRTAAFTQDVEASVPEVSE